MSNGNAPPELEKAIIDCVQTSVAGSYSISNIKPNDDQAYALGDYEQTCHVILVTGSGKEIATVKARKSGGTWHVQFIRSTI